MAAIGYQVRVRATNAEGDGAWTVPVPGTTNAAANVAPSFTSSATASVAENSTAVLKVTATDADSQDSVTYAITGGADQSKFSIGSSTGVLTFNTPPDFENPTDAASTNPSNAAANNEYVLVVTATGGVGARAKTATQTIVVTVTDVNEPPSFTSSATASVTENSTAVLKVTATDADAADSVTAYAVTGGADQSKFSITSPGGALTFNTAPDYENPTDTGTNNIYNVTVQATSGAGSRAKTATQTIVVTVTDVNEPPSVPTGLSVSAIDGSSTSLRATWTAPTNTGRPAISGYKVQYRQGTSGDWTSHTHSGTATTADITSLMAATAYQVQVRATNAEGDGPWTASASGTTNAAADVLPRNLKATPSSTSVMLKWDHPNIVSSDRPSGIYRIRWRTVSPQGQWELMVLNHVGTQPEYNVQSLRPATEYEFQVAYLDRSSGATIWRSVSVKASTNEVGTVLFDAATPWAGAPLTAMLEEPYNGSVSALTWTWERLEKSDSSSGTVIVNGRYAIDRTSAYIPREADVGKWLRATAHYTDSKSKRRSAQAVSTNSVKMETVIFSATAPTVSAINITSTPKAKSNPGIVNPDTYRKGEVIQVTATFNEAVTVTGIPFLKLSIGDSLATAAYASGSGTTSLVFNYTVADRDRDDNGVSVPGSNPIFLSSEDSIRSSGGEDANLRHSGLGDQSGHKVYSAVPGGSAPKITDISIVSAPASGDTYGNGERIEVEIKWDQFVRGLHMPYPSLTLTFGAGETTSPRTARMAISRADKSRFRYVVQPGDTDTDGIGIPKNPLTVPLGSFIRNSNNNADADLTYAKLAAQSGHKVDGSTDNVRPVAPSHVTVSGRVTSDHKARIRLSWYHLPDHTITGYEYQQDSTDAWVAIPPNSEGRRSFVVTDGVTRDVRHTFRIRAVDKSGPGEASPPVTVTWETREPYIPEGLTAVAGDGQVTLSWDDPLDPSITHYQYQWVLQERLDEEAAKAAASKDFKSPWSSWVTIPNSDAETVSHTVSELNNDAVYYIRIRAVNGVGPSSAAYIRVTPTAQ